MNLRRLLVVLQAALQKGLPFDAFAFEADEFTASGVDVGWGQIAQALVITPVVVMFDEGLDLGLQVAGQVVVFEQDAVL